MSEPGAGAARPPILVLTSSSSPAEVVVPVLAALEVAGAAVRALEVGRLGARADGVAQRVVRAVAGEVAGRRLERAVETRPPAVVVAFDPASAGAAAGLGGARRAAVAAIVPELDPEDDWGEAVADRFLVLDEPAAAALQGHGVEGERVVAIGPIAPARFAAAGLEEPAALRTRFRIAPGEPVVVVEVAGLGHEGSAQLAMQLSLTALHATYLFSAGEDVEAAAALRARVPALGLRAKLFGATADAPLYHRAADVVVAPPRLGAALAALAVGARLVVFGEGGADGRRIAAALERRGVGLRAEGALLIGAALERIATGERGAASDGAAGAAAAILVMARDAAAIAGERADAARARAAERSVAGAPRPAAPPTRAAGELEDLGEGDPAPPRGAGARRGAPRSSPNAPAGGGRPPPRSSRSIDEELSELKRQGARPGATRPAAAPQRSAVDDELDALKRRISATKKGPP